MKEDVVEWWVDRKEDETDETFRVNKEDPQMYPTLDVISDTHNLTLEIEDNTEENQELRDTPVKPVQEEEEEAGVLIVKGRGKRKKKRNGR